MGGYEIMTKRFGRLLPSLAAIGLLSPSAFATGERTAAPSLVQKLAVERANRQTAQSDDRTERAQTEVARPYAEFEHGSFLLISASPGFNSLAVTTTIADNLPSGVKLVVLASSSSEQQSAMATYGQYLDRSRLSVVNIGTRTGLWTRDSLPIPVWSTNGSLNLVDARYYHGNEPDSMLAQAFRLPLLKHNYYFEGGNLMNDDEGHCLVVGKTDTNSIPDDVFKKYYGCQQLTRLPHVAGIGHVDERVKILSGKRAVTDEPSYVSTLRSLGYTVTQVPRPRTNMGTYANALLVNGTIFLPVYGESGDAEAQRIYERLGFHVVPASSSQLSSQGKGSIHCITMVYPGSTTEAEILSAIRGE